MGFLIVASIALVALCLVEADSNASKLQCSICARRYALFRGGRFDHRCWRHRVKRVKP